MIFADTIVAIATPPGMGAIGIVRMSGDQALSIAQQMFVHPRGRTQFESHQAYYGQITEPSSGKALDQGLLLYMRGPHSYTGEDSIEFQCHGGMLLLKSVLECCLALGARQAEPGEFSQRAFLNGKMDLTQAEAVIDLIHGKTRPLLSQAAVQLEGHLSSPIRALRARLLSVLVSIEANIDFPDEVDPPDDAHVAREIHAAVDEVAQLLETSTAGRLWREGVKLALVGQPNVGKSTLLNSLLRYERAIVSAVPGTTRDTVEDDYSLRQIPIRLVDTAGLRDTDDVIETIGIQRSREAMAQADVVLLVADRERGFGAYELDLLAQLVDKPCLAILNKCDQPLLDALPDLGIPVLAVSARDGIGIEALEEQLYAVITEGATLHHTVTINDRHRQCLLRAQDAMQRVMVSLQQHMPGDFLAIDLKDALAAFGDLLGDSLSEEVIHEIFHRFCVGK
jgi:tRNA modification GTPase